MNPLRIRAEHYRTFRTLDLEPPPGRVAIIGPNGAGKSSIVNAIDLAIFGPESRSLSDYRSKQAGDGDDLLIELEFEHAGEMYRVRRRFSAKGRGSATLDFEVASAGGAERSVGQSADGAGTAAIGNPGQEVGLTADATWEPLTLESAKETQALIERTIGLSRETFRASAFLAQGDGAAFTEASPRDRKRILAEVLQLGRYDRLLDRAKAERKQLEEGLQRLAGRFEAAERTVEGKAVLFVDRKINAGAIEDVLAKVTAAEHEQAEAAKDVEAARTAEHERRAAEALTREARTRLERLLDDEVAALDAQAQLGPLADKITDLERQAARLPDVERRLEENRTRLLAWQEQSDLYRRMESERTRLLAESETALRRAAEIARGIGTERCAVCEQILGTEAAEKSIATYVKRSETALDGIGALHEVSDPGPRPDEATEDPEPLRRAAVEAAGLRERLDGLRQRANAIPDRTEIEALKADLSARQATLAAMPPTDLAAAEARAHAATDALTRIRGIQEQLGYERARLDERLDRIRQAEQTLAQGRQERDQLHERLDVAAVLERAFSPNGIPMLIVEATAVPYLEAEATRILAELDTEYRIELRTQAELKTGDGLRDTLDVIVYTLDGERAYETFSGGERTRLNLALRIALARLLAHRRGAESRLLCIDEPEFLDDDGIAALVDVLAGLEDDFDRLYLISHVPALRDSFDEVVAVERTGAGSTIAGMAALGEEQR
jgi:exonuclease SbcC